MFPLFVCECLEPEEAKLLDEFGLTLIDEYTLVKHVLLHAHIVILLKDTNANDDVLVNGLI